MAEPDTAKEREYLEKVNGQLSRYAHPLFEWEARNLTSGVEVAVRLKVLRLKPREIEARGFEWDFQRQLFNCLHDYLVEMFTRSPHITEI